jgi:Rod binding domain-containing protein
MASSIASSLSGAMSASPLSTPGPSAIELLKDKTLANKLAKTQANMANANLAKAGNYSEASKAKAKAASEDFEAVFLNTMFQQMFTELKGDGPFGGNGATGVWRSFLTDEYSKSFAKSGGIGIADQVYSALLSQQEAHQ